MRKSPLIIIPAILIGLTGVYALVANLLPDTSEFPRVPTTDGTIGGYIAKILGTTDLVNYAGDGTVENTQMLSGVTADKLLRGNTDCTSSNVWTGLNNGTPTCGTDTATLASIGTTQSLSGTALVYHASGSWSTLTLGSTLREGDIIQTQGGSDVSIVLSDGSVLRIAANSTVSLDIGQTTSGQSLAYAILENGGLWGRVLTETGGYYIGNDDVIAGVRGTSLYAWRGGSNTVLNWNPNVGRWEDSPSDGNGGLSSSNQITISVIHSRADDDEPAATIECTSASGVTLLELTKGQQIRYMNYPSPGYNPCAQIQQTLQYNEPISLTTYYADPIIAANTIADLNYMSGMLARGALTVGQRAVFSGEYAVTRPTTTAEKDAICTTGSDVRKTFWESLVGRDQTIFPVCQPSETLAYANYSGTTSEYRQLYLSGGSIVGSGTLESANRPQLVYTGSQIENILNGNWMMEIPITLTGGNSSSQDRLLTLSGSNGSILYIGYTSFGQTGTLKVSYNTQSGTITIPKGSDTTLEITRTLPNTYSFRINGETRTISSYDNYNKIYIGMSPAGNAFWTGKIYSLKLKN